MEDSKNTLSKLVTDNEFTSEELDNFYTHLTSIWEIIPESVKEKFKREQKCSLCNDCKDYLLNLQHDVKESKMEQQRVRDAKATVSEQSGSGLDASAK